jgi:hypothetical protein
MKLSSMVSAALLPFAVACAPSHADEVRDIKAPAATVVGEPVRCIDISAIRNTQVWDDYTIDFITTGGHTYRNTLDSQCLRLGFEERFAYETSLGQLCSSDRISVLDGSGHRGVPCGLGEFVPVEVAKK